MNHQDTEPKVLARFPRIRSSEHSKNREVCLESRGRWLNQAMSFKLLAAAALILIAVAIVPLTTGTGEKSAESPTEVAPLAVWHPEASSQATEAAVPLVESPAPTPPSTDPLPNELPQPEIVNVPPPTELAEASTMSSWPNPNHPTTSASENSENPTTAIHPPESIQR